MIDKKRVKNKRKLEEIYWKCKQQGLSSAEAWEKAKRVLS